LPQLVNNSQVNNDSNAIMDTIREELPDIRTLVTPDTVKAAIQPIKRFSWAWMLASLVVFIIAEIGIAGLFQTNLFWSFIPHSFRFLVEIVSFSISFLLGGITVHSGARTCYRRFFQRYHLAVQRFFHRTWIC
jgi:hypothetical protein